MSLAEYDLRRTSAGRNDRFRDLRLFGKATAFGRIAERPQITWPFGMIIFPEVFDIICSEWLMMTSEYELCATALRFCAVPSFQPTDY